VAPENIHIYPPHGKFEGRGTVNIYKGKNEAKPDIPRSGRVQMKKKTFSEPARRGLDIF